MKNIRNFAILAHIDHGKSTLADRFLEITNTVEKRKMRDQLLDTMDLERERGITIKLQPATMIYKCRMPNADFKKKKDSIENRKSYILNLIDTPGHVDFGYEVSRSLAAVEGAILLVDASQGVQAQTLANLYQAIEYDLEIIPVLNKIDLPNANVEKTSQELINILGCKKEEIIKASGKTGEGVKQILDAIVEKIPAPKGEQGAALRALIFDSKYDSYRGVLAYVRIVDGEVKAEDDVQLMKGRVNAHVIEVGKFSPELKKTKILRVGDIGYIATGLKSVTQCRVGDTVTSLKLKVKSEKLRKQETRNKQTQKLNKDQLLTTSYSLPTVRPLPGYRDVKPMVYASFYPTEGEDYNQFREALEKLQLNDAALTFEGESSPALGRGFRIGFLGLLHLEIVQERLNREFNFQPVITTPSVVYRIVRSDKVLQSIFAAAEMPEANLISEIKEPFVKLDIITPKKFMGGVMEVVQATTRAKYLSTDYIDEERMVISFDVPLSEVIVNLHDAIQSASSGYASFSYEVTGYRAQDLVRMDVWIAEEKVDAFSQIVPRAKVEQEGRRIVSKLKDVIPRQNFLVKIQAAVGGKFIARENIKPFRKDVTSGLYGGDITRKRKVLEKQKKGKKRMKGAGKVEIPQKAFLEVLKK